MHAVIATGGKQYRVQQGDLLDIEKLDSENGEVVFSEVLSIGDGADIKIGTPKVEESVVKAEIVKHFRDKKLLVFKMKRRKGYRKRKGHRQNLTRVKITIVAANAAAAAADEAAYAAAAAVPATVAEVVAS